MPEPTIDPTTGAMSAPERASNRMSSLKVS
jgi:hypothetical protein